MTEKVKDEKPKAQIVVRHRFQGAWYKPGDAFKSQAHTDWALDPVRRYAVKGGVS